MKKEYFQLSEKVIRCLPTKKGRDNNHGIILSLCGYQIEYERDSRVVKSIFMPKGEDFIDTEIPLNYPQLVHSLQWLVDNYDVPGLRGCLVKNLISVLSNDEYLTSKLVAHYKTNYIDKQPTTT